MRNTNKNEVILYMDLNCDLGESYGSFRIGNDEEIIPLVDSVNIACGFHSGDPNIMNQTVQLAKQYNVKIGAHPGYPDLHGFGRRRLDMKPEEVYAIVLYQIGALHAFTSAHETKLHHVKPHGALYNIAATDKKIASAIANAIADFDPSLILFGLANSELVKAGESAGLTVWKEAFADRTYQNNGTLTPRSEKDAVLDHEDDVVEQVQLLTKHQAKTISGSIIQLEADTICVHGDNSNAIDLVKKIRRALGK